jgi:dephospho-CoA kinase
MPSPTKTKIILGLVGEIASGKDTVADYLKKHYGSSTISFSQPLREIIEILYLPINRQNMANAGIALRQYFGQDLLSKVIAEKVKREKTNLVTLPNVRLASDLDYLKKEPGFMLVFLDTTAKIRFERLKKRSQNEDDKTKTWTQFQKDSQLSTETQIRKLAKNCQLKLDNNGTKQELYRQIDLLANGLKLKKTSRN